MPGSRIQFDWNDEALASLRRNAEAAVTAGVLIAEGQIKQLTPVNDGTLRDSITHEVEKRGGAVVGTVGTSLDYAIYQEFGTGEFAENGAGRKGGWVYRAPDGTFHRTRGNRPRRMFRNGYRASKKRIIAAIQKRMSTFRG